MNRKIDLGVIGYGLRIGYMLDTLLKLEPDSRIKAIADPRADEIRIKLGAQAEQIAFYTEADEMLANERLDGVFIGTRCNLHTEMALKVLKLNLPLFLEKPVATTYEDLYRLKAGYEASSSPVVVSFPLRNTPLARLAKDIIDSGKIGTVEHVQAVNNVNYGGVYYHHWYRDESITGGLFLQKATHDFDYMNYLVGQRPQAICAMRSKQIFKGNKPVGLTCAACEEKLSCPESTIAKPELGAYCCFGVDTGNEDSGSALIRYESGLHAAYSQNFFVRNKAAKRGARLMGYKGTLEFDWVTNELHVYMHHELRVETHKLDHDPTDGHGGGDSILLRNFMQALRGEAPSETSLAEGLWSALLCLKANESADNDKFCTVAFDGETGV
ncbi:oxidoreductase [Paenibacillus sp. 598K]|uniref:Gfo/Idh/MocA family protein n=1 Tax=Paenibacillus sp. 598K TaxID=1117987 RepID=UPI000FFAEDA9|nr:Gfo/Idh/MocA family oxidoreductase [Paenibacillus sp. 598K]GBF77697.1 oxidoreductase [Paenibacillus sp. 598K]